MKYKPSTFIVVPNKRLLMEIDATAQAVFMWLCDHAHRDTGKCFPSVDRLSKLCRISKNTVRSRIKKLEHAGLIIKTARKRDERINMSNLYQIIIDERPFKRTPSSVNALGGSTNE